MTSIQFDVASLGLPVDVQEIPSVIHQTWKTEAIPKDLQEVQRTWTQLHPHFTYQFWTDDDLEAFMQTSYPWFYPLWQEYPHNIQRIDSARYFIMYHFGGIYADLDMQCLTSFEPLLDQIQRQGVILGHEGMPHKDLGTPQIGNALIISSPHHPFWLHVFQGLIDHFAESDPEKLNSVFTTTGPAFLHHEYLHHPQGLFVLPSSAFYPLPWHPNTGKEIKLVNKRQYPTAWACHLWSGLWREAPLVLSLTYQQETHVKVVIPYTKTSSARQPGYIERSLRQKQWPDTFLHYVLESLLQPVPTEPRECIVVGGYLGQWVLPLALLLKPSPESVIHVFEPHPTPRTCLQESLRLNHLDQNVYLYDLMPYLNATTTLFMLNKPEVDRPHRQIWRTLPQTMGMRRLPVTQVCQSTVLDALPIRHPLSLVMIQAGSEEVAVLQGATQLLGQHRPALLLQIWADDLRTQYQSTHREQETWDLLDRLQYQSQALENNWFLCLPNASA